MIEEKFVRLDGTTFEAEVAAMPFSWQGKPAIQVVLRDVTERRKAEQAIRGSEAKYRTLVENVLDGVYQTTPDGEILTANPALARMLGYESEADLLLLNAEKDLYIDMEERREYLAILSKGGRVKNAEFKLRRKDGQIVVVLENARAVRNKQGEVLYYEGTLTDITELKNAQEALRVSEERFRAFIEQSAEAIWCFESSEPMPINWSEEKQIMHFMENGRLAQCNDTMARMYGFEHAEELHGAKLKELLDPTDQANIEYLRLFIRSKYRLIDAESHANDKSGNSKYFFNNMIGIVENEKLVRVWGTQRDITEERKSDQKLQESEWKFRALTEIAASAIFIYRDEQFCYVNPATEKLSGYSKEELLQMKLWDIVHPDDKNMVRERYLARLNGENPPIRYEFRIVTKNGEDRWIDFTAGVTSYDGKPAGLGTAFDITEQKRNSEERYQQFVEDNSIGLFIADLDGTVLDCNSAFLEIMDYKSRNDVIKANVNVLGESKQQRGGLLKDLQKTSRIIETNLKLKNASGRQVSIIANIITTRDDAGNMAKIKGTIISKKAKK